MEQSLISALERFAEHPRILIALDFDGCVAELTSVASQARPVPENARAIETLAALDGVELAYVSGRSLETLRELADPPAGVLLIGSHGAEKDLGEDAPGLQLSSTEEIARGQIIDTLTEVAADAEGAWVEHKPAGAALHVRNVDGEEHAEHVLEHGRAALALVDGAYIKNGKKVLESVVVLATKGEGITELREHTTPDAVLFAGDDVTDEQGFAVLSGEDIGLKVGEGETAATHRIAEPKDLAGVLRLIADRRADHGQEVRPHP
ncbi:trehalose-phosphatase [Nesterenkonia lutea]|uniref:Trehalose 6-phosphate phosphatase n=1 Tax=Nesterenkonia lutea TaxID=272919 RepID=A0ABR9JAC9_9MICC|nr:trehalose-phosphatase [Nesterenkonia lutea]MBE1522888.1 trehalose 6-phosphate phosphatase [Nesterenkonia lutea]